MPFKTNATLDEAYTRSKVLAREVKLYAVAHSAQMAADSVSANVLIDIFTKMIGFDRAFQEISGVPGISAYAKQQESDADYEVGGEFEKMRAAINRVGQTVSQKFDKHNGWLLRAKFSPSGMSVRTYDTTFNAAIVAELNSLVNTIG